MGPTLLPEVDGATPLLAVRGLSKVFPNGIVANDGVDLDLYPGEVHALLGENGAGKSTLVKMLYGFHRPNAGTIQLNGHRVEMASPEQARAMGIGMVFQNFMLIPNLSVVENVALALPRRGFFLRRAELAAWIHEAGALYGMSIDPWRPIWQLSLAEQQKVEIVKLLLGEARVLIFDEPTSVLVPQEVEALYQVFANLKANGYAVVFVTHKLHQVLACADRITVLRHGRLAGTLGRAGASEEALIRMILGRDDLVPNVPTEHHPSTGRPIVEVQGVTAAGDRGGLALRGVSLAIAPGEIVGMAGVSGGGQSELGEVLLGLRPVHSGSIGFDGEDATHWSAAQWLRAGAALVPEDPVETGVVSGLTVLENLALCEAASNRRAGWLPMPWQALRRRFEEQSARFGLPLASADLLAGALSGGNLQRLVLTREIGRGPRFLIAYHPSRGLDVVATHAVHGLLQSLREAGTAILVISEDLDELRGLSDRMAVMYHGEIVATMAAAEADISRIGQLMTGGGLRSDGYEAEALRAGRGDWAAISP